MTLKQKLEYAFYDVNNQSLLLDYVILVRTLPQIIIARGAYKLTRLRSLVFVNGVLTPLTTNGVHTPLGTHGGKVSRSPPRADGV